MLGKLNRGGRVVALYLPRSGRRWTLFREVLGKVGVGWGGMVVGRADW